MLPSTGSYRGLYRGASFKSTSTMSDIPSTWSGRCRARKWMRHERNPLAIRPVGQGTKVSVRWRGNRATSLISLPRPRDLSITFTINAPFPGPHERCNRAITKQATDLISDCSNLQTTAINNTYGSRPRSTIIDDDDRGRFTDISPRSNLQYEYYFITHQTYIKVCPSGVEGQTIAYPTYLC